jgi:hypothetical protein
MVCLSPDCALGTAPRYARLPNTANAIRPGADPNIALSFRVVVEQVTAKFG